MDVMESHPKRQSRRQKMMLSGLKLHQGEEDGYS